MAVTYEDFMAVLVPASKLTTAPEEPTGSFYIDTGGKDAARIKAAQGGEQWHKNVLELVGSLVAQSQSDEVILCMAPGLTLAGYTVADTIREMQPMILGARRKGFDAVKLEDNGGDPLAGYSIFSAQQLSSKTFPPIEWLIEPLLPRPSLTMLAGPPKVGKSWLCLFFALQVAEAGHEVIYIANEDNERRLQSRLCALSTFPPDGIQFIAGLGCAQPLPKGEKAHAFIRALKDRHPRMKCLVVDTLAAIRSQAPEKSKKDDYALSEEEFSALRKLAHELDLAIVLVHHTRKASESDASPVETILGSQGIAATVETIMVMKQEKGSQNVGLYVTGKDVEQQELVLPWQSPGFGWPSEMIKARLGPFQRKCHEFICHHPRCMQSEIAAALGCDKGQLSKAISTMAEYGLISRQEGGQLVARE